MVSKGENPGALAGMVKLSYAGRQQRALGLAMELRRISVVLPAINWAQPWMTPWRETGQCIARRYVNMGLVDALNVQGCPVRFVPQSDLPPGAKKATLLEFDRVLGLGLAA